MEFKDSITKDNLMRAFAGESQARNRYTMAAETAKKNGLYVIEGIFTFTADQERAHAQVFYNHLKELSGQTIHVDGGYPVDISDNIETLLTMAQHNEYEEHDVVYKDFAKKAEEEGFAKVAASFRMIADVEKVHGERFGKFAQLMKENKLFVSDCSIQWMCMNCGYIYEGTSAPAKCPVCDYDRGYFMRLELTPYQ